jgi:hypothetical protein
MASERITIQSLARDVLRVNFSQALAANDSMFDLDNYAITPVTSGADAVEVARIIKGGEEDDPTVTYVDLQITKAALDATYQLLVTNLETSDSVLLAEQTGEFLGRFTKTDSFTRSVAQLYNTRPDSTLRQILTAMALEDERIGGQGDLSPLPADTTSEGTWNLFNWDDGSWG